MTKFWIASVDGKNYIVSNDFSKLPNGATPMPIHTLPTDTQLAVLHKEGATVAIDLTAVPGQHHGRPIVT